MMDDMKIRQERLLIVDPNPEPLLMIVKDSLSRYDINIYVARSGIEGLEQYKLYSPGLLLINCELPDMSGMSVSSIIKDGENGRQIAIFLFNLADVYQNTKADFFFMKMDDATFSDMMQAQLKSYYDEKIMKSMHSLELQEAQRRQYQALPEKILRPDYNVLTVFSAYSAGLSGDCYDYWVDHDGNLYGLLIDCTGHDITAYSQVTGIRGFLKKDLKLLELNFYHSLSEVLQSVNEDLFSIDQSPEMTAAIVFKLDIKEKVFHYCTSGIPGILIKEKGKWRTLEDGNYLLGCTKDATFEEATLDLTTGIQEIICCSDGFYELVFHKEGVEQGKIAKHDDVSAVVIQMKK